MRKSLPIFGLAVALTLPLVSHERLHAFDIALNYSDDSSAFFIANPLARAALEAAAADVSAAITSQLSAVTTDVHTGSNGSTTVSFDWDLFYLHPTNGNVVTLGSFTIPANQFVLYVGAQPLGTGALGMGGAGAAGYSASFSGFPSELSGAVATAAAASNASLNRGTSVLFGSFDDTAMLGSSSTNYTVSYGPLLGSVWFDNDTDNNGFIDDNITLNNSWHFDHTIDVALNKNDFYSVAVHEIIHALGFASSESYFNNVSGTDWLGVNAATLHGSTAGLLTTDGLHIADNFMSTRLSDGAVQEAALTPSLAQGTRKYLTVADAAFLQDMGYQVIPEPGSFVLLAISTGFLLGVRKSRQS